MSGLFGSKPKVADPTPMPVPDDAASKAADLRQRQQVAARTGRASTMLSRQNGGQAGTTSYGNSLLGQAG
ncbi:hypothetical protein EN858_14940 [Mesorhizobium sp. M4B.F.Ca.ET.215.01.1.1]|uniref:hypothetical protein n=1 Tax=unclassified Mesorhizobium TaxID=325217 RepID=UPI0010940153|nr:MULTISPECIES: hypothetical protein [unclassified Mesorhizobium]TGQ11216.1 hypothetical protein EN858_14940 [Mesorhizobium sp. M4B.F.Ca.ET.215.01.1.1]TGR04731.1 hypothetical protein EN846_13140 [Mesorhizobium sp. M4B.F.Ca.ET.203.01.1.1]